MDEFSKALLVHLWSDTVDEIGEEAFDKALRQVLQTSTFRPDIAEIRRAAGVNDGIIDPVEHDAKAALKALIEAMRKHGPSLKPIIGRVVRDRDDDGRMLNVCDWVRAPTKPAPELDDVTEACLLSLGMGDRFAGLEVVARHPSLPWNLPDGKIDTNGGQQGHIRQRLVRDLEAQWISTYREARKQS